MRGRVGLECRSHLEGECFPLVRRRADRSACWQAPHSMRLSKDNCVGPSQREGAGGHPGKRDQDSAWAWLLHSAHRGSLWCREL